jgi:hypothetical protein
MGIKMEFVTMFHGVDTIMKQCGLEVACSNDFMGDGHP